MTDTAAMAGEAPEQVNILVVDDLPEKHVVFRTILDELGQNIVSARSGQEALKYILDMEFAVILLDVNMPDIDGLETAGLIRQYKKSAQTPIVFITAYVDELQARRGYALGAVDYIPSPVVPEVLRSKVRVFCELFRMNRQLQKQAAQREALARSEAARQAAESAIHRADYLAQASEVLSRSLNLDQTIATLLDLCVPMLGDRAILGIPCKDGGVRRLEMHPPPRADEEEVFSPDLRAAADRAVRDKQFQFWQRDGRAAAVCPLMVGDQIQAALALLGPAERFDSAHIALIREVASRGSIAMENAQLYSEVQAADRRKNEFLAMLAHELRNPLAPIRNAVHILSSAGDLPPKLAWARDVIGRQADHMARLIDDLLDVSRIVQGKVAVKPEPLRLATVVERSVESAAPKLAARDQVLEVRLPPESVEIDGDAVRLAQVISNLVNNASKFSPAGAAIALDAGYADGEVRICVRDPGAGIAPEFLPRIFDLFAQADQSLDRSQGGLGIGLTLVKHLVELHGGRVWAHSAGLGQGTEVTLALPARVVQPAQAPDPAPAARPATPATAGAGAGMPSRILVVDDLAASAETLMTLLQMEGFEVRVAHEGQQALAIAREFRPEVVLLDIGLPGMNGFEVANVLRRQPESQHALLIALTGYGEAESRSRSAQAGFDFHMVKPADVNLLLTMIANPREASGTVPAAA